MHYVVGEKYNHRGHSQAKCFPIIDQSSEKLMHSWVWLCRLITKNFNNKFFEKNILLWRVCAYIYDFKGNFEKKKFQKNFKNFFLSYGGVYRKKKFSTVSEKIFSPQNSLEIINVRTNPLQKYIFFKNFISKILRN